MAQNQLFTNVYQINISSGSTPPTYTFVDPNTNLVSDPSGTSQYTYSGGGALTSSGSVTASGAPVNSNIPATLNYTGYGFDYDQFASTQGLIMQDPVSGNYYLMGFVDPTSLAGASSVAAVTDPMPMQAQPGVNFANPVTYCFFPGTLISTTCGKARVEDLHIGDNLLTAAGDIRPVRWIGRQTISTFFADKEKVLPVRITAGSLGAELPERDLLVSPDHAILVDGVLIQASALINGRTIIRETNVPVDFTWYHIETEDHALILAEGTPAETFIDNVSRQAFDNWEEYDALYPDAVEMEELDLPRVQWARQLPRVISLRLEAIADARMGKATVAA